MAGLVADGGGVVLLFVVAVTASVAGQSISLRGVLFSA